MPFPFHRPTKRRKAHRAALRVLVGVCTLSSGVAPTQAAADESEERGLIHVDFTFRGAPECPGSEVALGMVQQRSGRIVSAVGRPTALLLSMTVQHEPGTGYRGTLLVVRPGQAEERRSMTGLRCDEVVEALALTAALSIDPNATLTVGSPSDAPTPQFPPTEVQDKSAAADVRPAPVSTPRPVPNVPHADPRMPARHTLGLAATAQKQMRHASHLGSVLVWALSGAEKRPFFPLEVRVAFAYLTETRVREPQILTRFFLAQLAYCPLRLGARIELLVCPTSQLGVLLAENRGFAEAEAAPDQVARVYWTVGMEAALRTALVQKFELWLSPGFAVPLTERAFRVEPGPEHVTGSVAIGWTATLGVGRSF